MALQNHEEDFTGIFVWHFMQDSGPPVNASSWHSIHVNLRGRFVLASIFS
jgi:hypothetical protein